LAASILENNFWLYRDHSQGDQIGRIFAYWAIVYFGHLLKITEVGSVGNFFQQKKNQKIIYFDKKRLGLHFGDFFHKLTWSA
jgi:hypothetical protein